MPSAKLQEMPLSAQKSGPNVITLDKLIRDVSKLDLPSNDFVLIGTAPMLRKQLITDIGDIDILAKGNAWAKALTLGEAQLGSAGDQIISLENSIDVFNGWMGRPLKALFKKAEHIEGLPYAHLRDVLDYKLELNRPKDQRHIQLIRDYLSQ